jgi:hypothetical protein
MDQTKKDRMGAIAKEIGDLLSKKIPEACLPLKSQERLRVLRVEQAALYLELEREPVNLGEYEIVRVVTYKFKNGEELRPSMYSADKRPMRVEYDESGVPTRGLTTTVTDIRKGLVAAYMTFKLVTEFAKPDRKNVARPDVKFVTTKRCMACGNGEDQVEAVKCSKCGWAYRNMWKK